MNKVTIVATEKVYTRSISCFRATADLVDRWSGWFALPGIWLLLAWAADRYL